MNKALHLIGALDRKMHQQLNLILHHPALQKLESQWRALNDMLNRLDGHAPCKVKLLTLSKHSLIQSLQREKNASHTRLQHLFQSHGLDLPGAMPFSFCLVTFPINPSTEDHHLVQQLGAIGASIFTPFLLSASPALFHLDAFSDLQSTTDIEKIMTHAACKPFRQLQKNPISQFIAMALPDVLHRTPYDAFETMQQPSDFLWGSCLFVLATHLIFLFAQSRWFHPPSENPVPDTPPDIYPIVRIPDAQAATLFRYGFIALHHNQYTKASTFFELPTFYQNEQTQQQLTLRNQLCLCRLAQTLKIYLRNKIGTFTSLEQCAHHLNHWITQYCANRDDLNPTIRNQYPFREANIKLTQHEPGTYQANIVMVLHHTPTPLQARVQFSHPAFSTSQVTP